MSADRVNNRIIVIVDFRVAVIHTYSMPNFANSLNELVF